MSTVKRLLSVKELAEALGVCAYTIRRAYWKGAIPGFKICKVLRFDFDRICQVLATKGLSDAVHAGAVRIGESRPHGTRKPPVSNTGAQSATPKNKRKRWKPRRSS
ncbi:MAG: DNA-binding protein [Nitrospirae bacterium]|nr:MAG: DNA-binding protein [Nitrospirota bacterium]